MDGWTSKWVAFTYKREADYPSTLVLRISTHMAPKNRPICCKCNWALLLMAGMVFKQKQQPITVAHLFHHTFDLQILSQIHVNCVVPNQWCLQLHLREFIQEWTKCSRRKAPIQATCGNISSLNMMQRAKLDLFSRWSSKKDVPLLQFQDCPTRGQLNNGALHWMGNWQPALLWRNRASKKSHLIPQSMVWLQRAQCSE